MSDKWDPSVRQGHPLEHWANGATRDAGPGKDCDEDEEKRQIRKM
jgi:hypothetical protein